MKKFFYTFIFIVIISILYTYYVGIPAQREIMQYNTDTNTPVTSVIQDIQSGAITSGILVEMSGGIALDPYRHNSISGEERLYKGVPVTPIVISDMDCGTLDTELSRNQCNKLYSDTKGTKKNREVSAKEYESTNTGNISTGSSASIPSF